MASRPAPGDIARLQGHVPRADIWSRCESLALLRGAHIDAHSRRISGSQTLGEEYVDVHPYAKRRRNFPTRRVRVAPQRPTLPSKPTQLTPILSPAPHPRPPDQHRRALSPSALHRPPPSPDCAPLGPPLPERGADRPPRPARAPPRLGREPRSAAPPRGVVCRVARGRGADARCRAVVSGDGLCAFRRGSWAGFEVGERLTTARLDGADLAPPSPSARAGAVPDVRARRRAPAHPAHRQAVATQRRRVGRVGPATAHVEFSRRREGEGRSGPGPAAQGAPVHHRRCARARRRRTLLSSRARHTLPRHPAERTHHALTARPCPACTPLSALPDLPRNNTRERRDRRDRVRARVLLGVHPGLGLGEGASAEGEADEAGSRIGADAMPEEQSECPLCRQSLRLERITPVYNL